MTMILISALFACSAPAAELPPAPTVAAPAPAAPDPFEVLLSAPWPLADGFSSPVASPWRNCGDGCWTTSSPQPVLAPAAGRVQRVDAQGLVLEHLYFLNHERHSAQLEFVGLSPAVAQGQVLARGEPLGSATQLTVRLASGESPAVLLSAYPRLPVPNTEPVLALIHHELQEMRLYHGGVEQARYQVGFGQATGAKERRGDLRTPKGVYRVVQRSKGPFGGDYADYYGGHWMRLNYPNPWDAARGVDQGLITVEQQKAISRAWWAGQGTLSNTSLGGGIGLHGWAEEWSDEGSRAMSWGCIVLHLSDVAQIYEALPEGAMVLLF